MNEINLINLNKSIEELLQLKTYLENLFFKIVVVLKSLIEYNTNTSAEHPVMDDDIVRTIEKSIESRNKDT